MIVCPCVTEPALITGEMKMKTTGILTAAVLATLLGACASSNRDMSDSTSDYGSGNTSGSATDRAPSSSMPGASLSSDTSGQSSNSTASNSGSQNWSGVVVTIDPILRQDAAAMGVGVMGAAAAGGTMQSEGSPTDKVYRVTMRADDGTTQTVVLDSMPSYKNGDRIRYRNGSVQRE